ncbi:hypothetical protein D3C72_1951680 [compost metagenome]
MASGNAARIATIVVIMIGRKRTMQASRTASAGDLPCSRCATKAKSIIMIAFFLTMPINNTSAIIEITERSVLVSHNASSAPMPAAGSVDRMVTGCTRFSYSMPSTM